MGQLTLGCLLGQYGGAQSFDVESRGGLTEVRSWEKGGQCSWYFAGTGTPHFVHSSAQSLRIDVFSREANTTLLSYGYNQADDARARWFPEVDTHPVQAVAWVLVHPATSSGDFRAQLIASPNVSLVLPGLTLGVNPLQFVRMESAVFSDSATAPRVTIRPSVGKDISSQASILADDVLTAVDAIRLYPEWSFEARSELIRSRHRTRAGAQHDLIWSKYLAYSMPLRFLPGSEAELLNWWWERGFPLLLTLDSSDSEGLHVVRIVNETQPIGRRVRPYPDLWEGTLRLESTDAGGLAF